MPGLRIARKSREEMALLVRAGASPAEIANTFHCHLSTAYNYRQNHRAFRDSLPGPVSVQGRPRKMTREMQEGLVDWLLENAEDTQLSYREEMRHFIEEEYGIQVSVSTIGRMLKEAKISYKKVRFPSKRLLELIGYSRSKKQPLNGTRMPAISIEQGSPNMMLNS
jgi:transposase